LYIKLEVTGCAKPSVGEERKLGRLRAMRKKPTGGIDQFMQGDHQGTRGNGGTGLIKLRGKVAG